MHHTIHPAIIKILIESFKITYSYYSSPLTCPIQLTQYHSPHNRDKIFGSTGQIQTFKWKGTGLAHSTDHNTTVEAIHWARMAAKEITNTTTILIINHNDWTSQQIDLTTNNDIHTLVTIPPHTIQYNPAPEWPKYYQYIEPSLTTIICIHSQNNPTINLQIPKELTKILEITINTRLITSLINPTITNYHVKFSNAWKTTPTNNILPPTSILQTTLPTKYHHQHQHNYPPHQCIYTNGSFIPPTKNSEGQIVGGTARSRIYSHNKNIHIAEWLP